MVKSYISNDKELSRLQDSVDWSIRQLEHPRKMRVQSIRDFVGFHYNKSGSPHRMPVNMLALAVQIYVRQLAARAPRVLMTTKKREYQPTALELQLALNQIPDEINLTATLRKFVTEAMFSFGIVKCGLYTVGSLRGYAYGAPFVDNVTIDDYFCDMTAKVWDQIDYEGNDYWADYEGIMESDDIPKKNRRTLKPDEYTNIGDRGEDRAEQVSTDNMVENYRKKLWLRDVFIPEDKVVLTYGVKSKKLLREVEWDGVETGPYTKLGFSDVPGNLLPLAPVQLWRDLNELGNRLFRKLGAQADSEKTVQGFPGGNDDAVQSFAGAKDGDGIAWRGGEPKVLTAGGVNAKTLAFYLQCRDLYSYFAGNLDSLGGLAPMTETLGQDKLLGEAASAQLRDMAGATTDAVKDIFDSLSHYEWSDPIRKRTLEKTIPNTSITVRSEWGPQSKKGKKLSDFDLQIDVYSLQDDSPGLKLQKLGLITQNYVMPFAPLIEKQNGEINIQEILKLVAQYSNMPELADIVTFMEPQFQQQTQGEQPATPGGPQQPPASPGGSGMSPQGATATLTQQLLAMDSKQGPQ